MEEHPPRKPTRTFFTTKEKKQLEQNEIVRVAHAALKESGEEQSNDW